ncbi:MAG: CatB-related O-acetyltransferase [Thermodesulfobacteriota bacterium]
MIMNISKNIAKFIRKNLFYRQKGVRFGHNCRVGWKVSFEGMNKLTDRVTFFDSHIGYASYVGDDSVIVKTEIGRYTSIASGVKTISGLHPTSMFVSTHPCFYSLQKQSGFTYVGEQLFDEGKYLDEKNGISIVIGNDVWIGANTIIMPGIKVSDGAIIAAGSILNQNVEPYGIYGGAPARLIRYRFSSEQIEFLLRLKWWDKDKNWLQENAHLFDDIDKFIQNIGLIQR